MRTRPPRKGLYALYLLAAVAFAAAYPLLERWVNDRRARTFDGRYYWLIWGFLVVYALFAALDGWVSRRLGLGGREAFLPRMAAAAAGVVLLAAGIWGMWGLAFQYLLVLLVFLLAKALAERRT